jgi:predicted DNA-binding transcriptional regulator AlpA
MPALRFTAVCAVGSLAVPETWTSAECAAAWGVRTPTWLGYVSRGQAPQPLPGGGQAKRWDADEVRAFPRPGVGHSRAGAGAEAEDLLARMRDVATEIDTLRTRQRELLVEGRAAGLELSAMAKALGISRQTAYGWLR